MGKQRTLWEEAHGEVLEALASGGRHDEVILIIPSHDKKNRPLTDQDRWAQAGEEVFAQLYGGATSFRALSGIFMDDETGELLRDVPILIECYAERQYVEDPVRLKALLQFAVRMGQETRQHTVALVVNDFIHFIPVGRG